MAIVSSNVASKVSQNLQNLIDAESSEILATQSAAQKIQDSNKTAVLGPIKIRLNQTEFDDQTVLSEKTDTGTERSWFTETNGNNDLELGDKSIRTEEMKQLTLEELKQATAITEAQTKEFNLQAQKEREKAAKLIAEQEEIRAEIEAIQASRLEKKKQWAKEDAIKLQAEIEKEMSEAQSERLEKILQSQSEERQGGESQAAQLKRLTELKDKLDEEKTQGINSGQFVNQGSKIAKGIQEEKNDGDSSGQFVNKGQQIGLDIENEKNAGEKGAQFVDKSKDILDQIESEKGVKDSIYTGTSREGVDRQTLNRQSEGEGDSIYGGGVAGGSGDSIAGSGNRKGRGSFRRYTKDNNKKNEAKRVNELENNFQEQNGANNVRSMMAGGPNDPYAFSTLSYPPDATNSKENGHFMLFYVNVQNKTKYSYDGLDSSGKVVPVGDVLQKERKVSEGPAGQFTRTVIDTFTGASADTGLREAGLISDVEYQKQIVRNGGKGNILYNNQTVLRRSRKGPKTGINSRYPTTTRITDSVALYLPAGIGTSQSANYGDFETGLAGYAVFSGVDIATAYANDDFVAAASQAFDKSATLIKDAIKGLSIGLLEGLGGGEGLQQSFDKIFGQTLNPYIEVAYQSTGMRTFDYQFRFAPKSKAETEEVQAIIQLFRFHMLPEMKGTSHRYLTLPSTFDIHYMWQSGHGDDAVAKENSFYNKIATCVLTNVGIDYTPNGTVQSFGDGAPTQITMSLSFKETEMMTKQHINEGF